MDAHERIRELSTEKSFRWKDSGKHRFFRVYTLNDDIPQIFKGVANIPFNIATVIKQLRTMGEEKDLNFAHIRIVPFSCEHVNPVFLHYVITKSFLGVSSRDFCTITSETTYTDSEWVKGGYGIEEHETIPLKVGIVRGLNKFCGWHVLSDGKNCVVSYIIQTDIRGSFPQSMILQSISQTFKTFFEVLVKKCH